MKNEFFIPLKIGIFFASPRKANTLKLCEYFADELKKSGHDVTVTQLNDMDIAPCKGCYACQQVSGEYGCVQHDDMYKIVDEIVSSDIIVLATPIFTWYCTAQMKAMLDRLYGMNKFYGAGEGSLGEGKTLALLLSHGYEQSYATEPFETGMKRLCEHSGLMYAGMYSVRDENDLASFITPQAENGARVFAQRLIALEARKRAAMDAPATKAGFSIRVAVDEKDSLSASKIYSNSWRAGYKGILSDETIASVTDDGWAELFNDVFVTNRFILFIMSAQGEDIGACTVGVCDDESERAAEIVSFYFIKEYWGKKHNKISYAEHLMRYTLAVTARQGYKSTVLWTLKRNSRAIGFYQKCGFLLTGDEREIIVKEETAKVVKLKYIAQPH